MNEDQKRFWRLLASSWAVLLPFALAFRLGAPGEVVLYPLLAAPLFTLFYLRVERPLYFALLGLDLALAVAAGSALNTLLYYRHVSADGMTPVVGMLMAFLGVGMTLLITLILTIVKAILYKKDAEPKE